MVYCALKHLRRARGRFVGSRVLLIATAISLGLSTQTVSFAARTSTAKASSDSDAFVECIGTELSAAERLERFNTERFPFKVSAVMKQKGNRIFIDGIPVERVVLPKEHMPGVDTSSLYRFQRNGSARFIKIFSPRMYGMRENPTVEDSKFLDSDYHALLWAQEAGGPKVYRAGRIAVPHEPGGYPYFFFVEMDEIAAGEKSVTWKSGGWGGQHRGGFAYFVSEDFMLGSKPRTTRAMAQMFVHAFETHWVPTNVDLQFIAAQGKSAWIDADHLEQVEKDGFGSDGYVGLKSLAEVLEVLKSKRKILEAFQKDMAAELKKSKKLTETEKAQIISYAGQW